MSLPDLSVSDRVVLLVGSGKGMVAHVSAVHPITPPGYAQVDFEDGVRCILAVEKLKKL